MSNERLVCQGGYDAFAGDTQAVFQVRCNNGLKGKAQIVRDRNGRNGIGGLYMDDGTVGKIVFGPDTLGAARNPAPRP